MDRLRTNTNLNFTQDSDIQEAAPQASENIVRSSLLQSYDDPATLKKSALQSISEEPELLKFPVKKGSIIRKSRNTKKPPKGQSRSHHRQHISQADKPVQQMGIAETLKIFPQMENLAKMIPVFINQNILRAETVPGASNKITSFSSVPITEKDEPHNRRIPNWPKKQRPKSETEQPPPVPSRTHRTSNISLIQTEKKIAPLQSIAGVSKKLEQPFLVVPQKEDQKLVLASSKEETTLQLESGAVVSKQLEEPSLILPPKKNPKFTSPILAEKETAPIKSIGEVSEILQKLALIPPQNEDIGVVSSVMTEENIAQVKSADNAPGAVTDIPTVPVNQNEDLQNIQLPPQQTNEISENRENFDLLLKAIESMKSEQNALVELNSKLSEEVERIPPVSPITSDDTNIPSIQKDEKTAQEIQSSEASEGCEKAPPVSPRTKFLVTDGLKYKTVQVDTDLAQLGGVARKIKINEETRLNEQNKGQSDSAEQVPPVPQKRKFPESTLPLLLKENKAKADSIEEALKQIGYVPSPSLRPENISYVPLIPIEENSAQDDMILDEPMELTYFPSVPIREKDIPHNRYVQWPRRKTGKLAQKPAKKTKRLPSALLKIKDSSCTSQLSTEEEATQVEQVSVSPKVSAQAPSVSFSSENLECSSPVTLENTAHTSPTPSKSTSKTAQPQSIPQKPQNGAPDSTSPPAEDEWQNFKISNDEFVGNQSTELGLPEAVSRCINSNLFIIGFSYFNNEIIDISFMKSISESNSHEVNLTFI